MIWYYFKHDENNEQNWPGAADVVVDDGSVPLESAAVELTLTDDIELGELGLFIPDDVEVELVFVVVVVTVVGADEARLV